jgi:alpha/beta superfamily hydrolase
VAHDSLTVMLRTADEVQLVADITTPSGAGAVAVLCHPHPTFGGDRHAIVVDPLFAALPARGIAAVRFDFRGAGDSGGEHDGGRREVHDVVAAIDAAVAHVPGTAIVLVGYSFGAAVALQVDDTRVAGRVAIAPVLLPSVDWHTADATRPALLVLPAHDQFTPAAKVLDAVRGWPATTVTEIAGADHFLGGFAGRLVDEVSGFVERITPAAR